MLALVLAASAHAAPQQDRSDAAERSQADRSSTARVDDADSLIRSMKISTRLHQRPVKDRASELVISIMGFLDVPYLWGGNVLETGYDCSGFVRDMYQRSMGKQLPRVARDQAAATRKIDPSDLKPGDLVFFKTPQNSFAHVGIYVGENKFVHAPQTGEYVRVEDMSDIFWQERLSGARRVIESQAGE